MNRTNPILGGGGFHHVAIRASDFDRTLAFYTEVLGFTVKISWGTPAKRCVMLDIGDSNYIEIFEGRKTALPPDSAEPPILHLALRTTRLDAVMERVIAAGMKVRKEAKDVTMNCTPGPVNLRLAFFYGPDGEIIELFQCDAL